MSISPQLFRDSETMSPERVCLVEYLGTVEFGLALELQQRLARARTEGKIPDVLLLLEHASVITTGRFMGEEDIIAPRETLAQKGIEIFRTNRGGSATYHCPGQLVGYPILDLRENRLGVREYVWKLEETIMRLLFALGIEGYRVESYPGGVWANGRKVCSTGIHVSHGVTMHGFALNVNNDLEPFGYINPCGIKGKMMTSLSELGCRVAVKDIVEPLIKSFSETFRMKCERGDGRWLNMSGARRG